MMADSLSVNVDSSPKLELSTEQSNKTTHEAEHSPISNIQKAIAELVGTYILIFAGCGAALVNERLPLTIVGIAIVLDLALTVAKYSVGHVSGGHFNPAVTIALAAVRKVQLKLVGHVSHYSKMQSCNILSITQSLICFLIFTCCFLGAYLCVVPVDGCYTGHSHPKVLYHNMVDIGVTVTKYLSSTSDLEAIVWESIITSILMLTICCVATDHRGRRELARVAIGISVLINIIIAGPITRASMNPARSLGPAIVSGDYKNIWVYIIDPTLGEVSTNS